MISYNTKLTKQEEILLKYVKDIKPKSWSNFG